MKPSRLALATLLACAATAPTHAAPAGTVLFAQPGTTILDAQGLSRPAHRGDNLQSGERIVTPANGISQLALPDGSLLGVRAGSELKFEAQTQVGDAGRPVVALMQGAMRVIGSELMDPNRLSSMSLRSGNSVLQMRAADLETAVVPGGAAGASSKGAQEGSYTRLLTGTATVGTGPAVTALAPRQVSFVAPAAVTPVTLTSISPTVFASSLPALTSASVSGPLTARAPASTSPIPTAGILSTTLTTNTLKSPALSAGLLSSLSPTVANPGPTRAPITAPAVLTPVFVAPTPVFVAPAPVFVAPAPIFIAPPSLPVAVYVPPPVVYVPPTSSTVIGSTITKTLSTTTLTCKLVRC
jgi:hypothetical protein